MIQGLSVACGMALAAKTDRKNHNVFCVIGGLGGAVCEVLSEHRPVPVKRLAVPDQFGEGFEPEWQAFLHTVVEEIKRMEKENLR